MAQCVESWPVSVKDKLKLFDKVSIKGAAEGKLLPAKVFHPKIEAFFKGQFKSDGARYSNKFIILRFSCKNCNFSFEASTFRAGCIVGVDLVWRISSKKEFCNCLLNGETMTQEKVIDLDEAVETEVDKEMEMPMLMPIPAEFKYNGGFDMMQKNEQELQRSANYSISTSVHNPKTQVIKYQDVYTQGTPNKKTTGAMPVLSLQKNLFHSPLLSEMLSSPLKTPVRQRALVQTPQALQTPTTPSTKAFRELDSLWSSLQSFPVETSAKLKLCFTSVVTNVTDILRNSTESPKTAIDKAKTQLVRLGSVRLYNVFTKSPSRNTQEIMNIISVDLQPTTSSNGLQNEKKRRRLKLTSEVSLSESDENLDVPSYPKRKQKMNAKKSKKKAKQDKNKEEVVEEINESSNED